MKYWEVEYYYFGLETERYDDEWRALRRFYELCECPLNSEEKLYEVTEEA